MIQRNTSLFRLSATVATFLVVNAVVPFGALASVAGAVKEVQKNFEKPAKPAPQSSRLLSAAEMASSQGKLGKNPYLAGQNKWDVVYKGINLMTGNYTTSGTDLTFEGGYGIPVNVTRSYSANSSEDGPLGEGWSLSVDVRSTAGGLLKSGSSPVRSVPTNFKERPTQQLNDPNATIADGDRTQPVDAVIASDAGGFEETIQRDADGILSTPPWDKNKIDSEYEMVNQNGQIYQVMKKNFVNTPEGTVYVYEKKGSYVNGTKPYDNASVAAEPSNVLKITSATDRHGNITTYTYGANNVTFTKSNGVTSEKPLTKIQMPNGHEINFTWGSGATANRIISASDGVRTVQYGYTNGYLSSVTTPGGKTTQYGYGLPIYENGWTYGTGGPVLTTITDPRGLTTTIGYKMRVVEIGAYGGAQVVGVTVWKVQNPNGTSLYFTRDETLPEYPPFIPPGGSGMRVTEMAGGNQGQILNFFRVWAESGTGTVTVRHRSGYSWDSLAGLGMGKDSIYRDSTQDLLTEVAVTGSKQEGPDSSDNTNRLNQYFTWGQGLAGWEQSITTTYNFMGAPLNKVSRTSRFTSGTSKVLENEVNVGYSYWGADKYYQPKATRTLGASDSEGGHRYSFTDYYDASAPQGSKGQTSKVYDEKRSQFILDNTVPIPPSSPALDPTHYWRYRIKPAADTYSAKFEYDLKGRPSKVWKIQKTTTSPWTYVRTETLYGADQAPTWGAATQVTEDAGGINRVTQTLAYDNIGRAIKVQDASGKVFETLYDLDGVIQGINQIVGTTTTPVVTYTYGTSGITNGAVLSVTDNLSGISQNITYFAAGSGVAQPATVSESGGPSTPYSVDYTYNSAGERETATYNTQAVFTAGASVKWLYEGYRAVGFGSGRSRVFQRMVRLDPATNARTPEEFHYSYDTNGRLREATFAMTPNATSTPTGGATYYTYDKPAATRARAVYDYDSGGHVTKLGYFWDTWSGSAYSSSAIQRNEATYEMGTGLRRGLKQTSSHFGATGGATRTESYSYDNDLDYLVAANYGDGLPNASVTWGYDAAGNRVSDSAQPGSWTYDNLNRMTASPGFTYANDVLGNRTQRITPGFTQDQSIQWDALNRMIEMNRPPVNATYQRWNYAYRADGMRTTKTHVTATAAGGPTTMQSRTSYRYDGQMGVEDLDRDGSGAITGVTRTGLGARSVEVISKTTSSGNTLTYPLYDIHGNMVAALSKAGSTFSVGEARTYDAWGQVRSQVGSDGKLRYCANLGHKQDDESGLIYMRARYYEPLSGRFVSEDVECDGINWFTYCRNDGVNFIDESGNSARNTWCGVLSGMAMASLLAAWCIAVANTPPTMLGKLAIAACLEAAIISAAIGFALTDTGLGATAGLLDQIGAAICTIANIIASVAEAMNYGAKNTFAGVAVFASVSYSIILLSYMVASIAEGESGFNETWN